MTTAALILAAGGGRRFSASGGTGHKLLTLVRGRPLVSWAIDAALEAEIGPLTIVLGAEPAIAEVVPEGITVVHCRDWALGQSQTLQAGVASIEPSGVSAIVVGLGDQPAITAEAWRRVAAAETTAIAVASFDGQRTPPVRLARSVWSDLPTSGDHGARELLRARPELVTEVPCPGSAVDIDAVGDLERWN